MAAIAPKDRLIFALDVENLEEAEDLVKRVAPLVGVIKVGPRLFTRFGTQIVEQIHDRGARLFLDLKFHDIPETVGGAAREVAQLRAHMFTVHALGGRAMIQRAIAELGRMTTIPNHPPPACLAVTILTSHTEESLRDLGLEPPIVNHAVRLARMAVAAGAPGIVASGHELDALRSALPSGTLFVVPGIRSEQDKADDQARTMTARQAIRAGATHLVVGRPIRLATDPADAARRLVDEIAAAVPV